MELKYYYANKGGYIMYYTSIKKYLDDIFSEFQKEVKGLDSLCNLKKVSFAAGNVPDYNDKAQALLYCLRYHFGYAFEYEYIYNNHILNSFNKETIGVLSVGCGNGIDLWALNRAIKRSHSRIKHINYLGVDCVDWYDHFEPHNGDDNISYSICEVTKLEDLLENIDVVIFPKSISEMRYEDLEHLAELIDRCSNSLYVIASLRSDSSNMRKDSNSFDTIIEMLNEKEYNISEGYTNIIHYFDGPNSIIKNYPDYTYPDMALYYLSNLFSKCEAADEDNLTCQEECKEQLRRQPILTTSQIRYQVLKIER